MAHAFSSVRIQFDIIAGPGADHHGARKQRRPPPCATPWLPMPRQRSDTELDTATAFLVDEINERVEDHRAICQQVQLANVRYDSVFSNPTGDHKTGGRKKLRFVIDVETVADGPQRSMHTGSYTGAVWRLPDFCFARNCWPNAWMPGRYSWGLISLEPLHAYGQLYEPCMGSLKGTDTKRYCFCDRTR